MFFILGLIVIVAGAIPLFITLKRRATYSEERFRRLIKRDVIILTAVILFLILINVFFHFYTDFLWFENLGYASRFLLVLQTKILLFLIGGIIAFLFYLVQVRGTKMEQGYTLPVFAVLPGIIVISIISAVWASGLWDSYLLFAHQASSSATDPIFSRSISFYLFSLSFLSKIVGWFLFLFLMSLAFLGFFVNGLIQKIKSSVDRSPQLNEQLQRILSRILVLSGLLLILIGLNVYLGVFRLLYSTEGVVTGAGWTDIHIRVPARYITVFVLVFTGILLITGGFTKKILTKVFGLRRQEEGGVQTTRATIAFPAIVLGVLLFANGIIPGIVQSVIVDPNEITKEAEYIPHNINFTRRAYGIDEKRITSKTFNVGRDINRSIINQNQSTIENIRLWDWRALMSNLQQQQEIRLYYQFHDVDIDRYTLNGDYRQMMLSVRELDKSELASESQTWVSRQIKYTHGYGLVMLPTHEFLPQGRPKLLIKDIPAREQIEDLSINRPQIYYGERTIDHVYTNTTQEEFDYPSGDENKFTTYEGDGGVSLGTILKRFVFAWKFDGHRQLFSGYFTKDSKVLYNRAILRRVKKIAPFLRLTGDPYAVLTDEGHIKYIIDAYTVSNNYPYSEAYAGSLQRYGGINYIRNSVKVIVDAYDGTTTFYITEPNDVIVETYKNMFPDLFNPFEEMPEYLKSHIRYPSEFFTIQAEMYRTYHMTDVVAFYQREDVWEFATERYRDGFYPVQPYYVMVHFPEEETMEYVIMLPYTPKNKNVINAWIAGRCDTPNYGKIMSFQFPKGVEVLGPRQIEARIDQDADMSRNLSLWSQRGSDVIRGNLLAVPLFKENTLYIMFVESIFLQAEGANMPEIKRVALADQDEVVWAESFELSLRKLVGPVGEKKFSSAAEDQPGAVGQPLPGRVQSTIDEAVEAFESYTEALSESNFRQAGEHLDQLKSLIQELKDSTSESTE